MVSDVSASTSQSVKHIDEYKPESHKLTKVIEIVTIETNKSLSLFINFLTNDIYCLSYTS